MAILLDTGIVYAFYDRDDAWHKRARVLFEKEQGGLIIPAPVIPEVDHLLGNRLGAGAQTALYKGLSGGDYFVADLPKEKYQRVEELNRQFAELSLGFVDAAIVAISEVLGLPRIATTDRRDFTPLAAAFTLELLP
ncbi:MAG TPA: PIN domain-containing protein [Thermoanaerobaculia bacterium]